MPVFRLVLTHFDEGIGLLCFMPFNFLYLKYGCTNWNVVSSSMGKEREGGVLGFFGKEVNLCLACNCHIDRYIIPIVSVTNTPIQQQLCLYTCFHLVNKNNPDGRTLSAPICQGIFFY